MLLFCVDTEDKQHAVQFGVPIRFGVAELVIDKTEGGYSLRSGADVSIGDQPLVADVPRRIALGDAIRVGESVGVLRLDAGSEVKTFEIAMGLVASGGPSTTAGVFVEVVEGPGAGRTLMLTESGRTYRVGRDESTALDLGDPALSRWHLAITYRNPNVLLRDLGSKGGVGYGKVRLAPDRDARWNPDKQVKIGSTVLALRGVDAPTDVLANLAPALPLSTSVLSSPLVAPIASVSHSNDAPAAPRTKRIGPSRVVMVVGASFVLLCMATLVWLFAGGR